VKHGLLNIASEFLAGSFRAHITLGDSPLSWFHRKACGGQTAQQSTRPDKRRYQLSAATSKQLHFASPIEFRDGVTRTSFSVIFELVTNIEKRCASGAFH
jgi:hypothetical protein